MPQTIIDLGKKVKAKYPGQYDDMDDSEVGRRVKSKFPGAYDDFTDAPDNSAILKQQAAKYPTAAEQGGQPGQAVQSGPGWGAVGLAIDPLISKETIETAIRYAPTSLRPSPFIQKPPELNPVGKLGAGMIADSTSPVNLAMGPVLGKATQAVDKSKLAANLMVRAARNRAPSGPSLVEGVVGAVNNRAGQVARRVSQPYRNAKATILEGIARDITRGAKPTPIQSTQPPSPSMEIAGDTLPPPDLDPLWTPRQPAQPSREIPFQMPEGQVPSAVNRGPQQIEQAMAPSGKEARLGTERIAPELAQDPVLAQVKAARFNEKLFERYKAAWPKVDAAEKSVPRTTAIPQEPVADALQAIVEKYRDMGATEAASAVAKEWEKWASKPSQILWDDFITMKRRLGKQMDVMGQFRESGTAAEKAAGQAMKEAYRVISDAGSVTDALRAANHEYWLMTSAMEDAGLSFRSGRKIAEIGNTPQPTMMDIAEQDLLSRVKAVKAKDVSGQ